MISYITFIAKIFTRQAGLNVLIFFSQNNGRSYIWATQDCKVDSNKVHECECDQFKQLWHSRITCDAIAHDSVIPITCGFISSTIIFNSVFLFIMLLAFKHTHLISDLDVFPCIPLHLLSSCTFRTFFDKPPCHLLQFPQTRCLLATAFRLAAVIVSINRVVRR